MRAHEVRDVKEFLDGVLFWALIWNREDKCAAELHRDAKGCAEPVSEWVPVHPNFLIEIRTTIFPMASRRPGRASG